MNERQFAIKFILYLIENKGYPKESLISELALATREGNMYHADLVILDLESNEYVGIVEFKNKYTEELLRASRNQLLSYKGAIGNQSIPLFFVAPKGEVSYQIFKLEDNENWTTIPSDEFPAYQTLTSQRKATEKVLNEIKEKNKEKRKQIFSYWSLSSLLLGIIASVLSLVFFQNEFTRDTKPYIVKYPCCDSLQIQIDLLKFSMAQVGISDSLKTTIDNWSKIKEYEDRLSKLEFNISSDPELVLSRLEIQDKVGDLESEIKHFREVKDLKIESIESRITIIYSIIIGIFLTLVSTMIGVVILFGKK